MSRELSHLEVSRRGGKRRQETMTPAQRQEHGRLAGKRCLQTMTPEARRERARLAGLASAAARRKRKKGGKG